MIQVKILENCTEKSINKAITELSEKYIVTKVEYIPETSGHYKSYCFIQYTKKPYIDKEF